MSYRPLAQSLRELKRFEDRFPDPVRLVFTGGVRQDNGDGPRNRERFCTDRNLKLVSMRRLDASETDMKSRNLTEDMLQSGSSFTAGAEIAGDHIRHLSILSGAERASGLRTRETDLPGEGRTGFAVGRPSIASAGLVIDGVPQRPFRLPERHLRAGRADLEAELMRVAATVEINREPGSCSLRDAGNEDREFVRVGTVDPPQHLERDGAAFSLSIDRTI